MKSLANAKGQSTTAAGHKPGSLLAQWKLVEAAVRDRRLSRGDIAVLFRVVDNHYHLYGNSRAAHSYLAAGTGLSRRAVISSTKRLPALGYLEVARIGSGTRPTEYVPNWRMYGNFAATSGEQDNISEVNCISPQESPAVNATSPKPAYVAGLQAGLRKQGPAPPPPRDLFDELWNVYGRKHERNKAKAEYQKLDPMRRSTRRSFKQLRSGGLHTRRRGGQRNIGSVCTHGLPASAGSKTCLRPTRIRK